MEELFSINIGLTGGWTYDTPENNFRIDPIFNSIICWTIVSYVMINTAA